MFYTGYVALIGKPNAGKSSLVNALIGEKVAIVSRKPQTTRDNILGIYNREDCQIIFVDTPGVHHSKNSLDSSMMKNVRTALAGVDLVLYLIDGTTIPDEEELSYIEHINCDKLVVRTKTDLKGQKSFESDLEVSSITGDNLERLIEVIKGYLSAHEKPFYVYPPDYYTDKSVKFIIAEEIRENALNNLEREIPHGVAVEIIRFDEREDIVFIDADIVCEQESHKGIIIGKGGNLLKKIGVNVRRFAEDLLGKKIMLKLFVKVEKDWRNKPQKIKNLGY